VPGEEGIDTAGLIGEAGRPTATATRVIGGGPQIVSQQIARIDRIVREPIAAGTQARLIAFLERAIPRHDALVVSDYEHGLIAPALIAAALPLARHHGHTITVDAHGDLGRFVGITIATPNQDEAAASLGRALHTDDDVCRAGHDLARQMAARAVLITRGSEGMTLAESDGSCRHLPAAALSKVRDATGAGDTVSAVVTLALAGGASLADAARLSNLAAGIVVRRLGAAVVTPGELAAAIDAAAPTEERSPATAIAPRHVSLGLTPALFAVPVLGALWLPRFPSPADPRARLCQFLSPTFPRLGREKIQAARAF
jgi:rfaE bifunctional protein kinase chain/domain